MKRLDRRNDRLCALGEDFSHPELGVETNNDGRDQTEKNAHAEEQGRRGPTPDELPGDPTDEGDKLKPQPSDNHDTERGEVWLRYPDAGIARTVQRERQHEHG